jgi:hypothetical protein
LDAWRRESYAGSELLTMGVPALIQSTMPLELAAEAIVAGDPSRLVAVDARVYLPASEIIGQLGEPGERPGERLIDGAVFFSAAWL